MDSWYIKCKDARLFWIAEVNIAWVAKLLSYHIIS